MSQDPFHKNDHLRLKLDNYHVDVPDFPRKPNRWGRFINFLASPAHNPLEAIVSTSHGFLLIKLAPMAGIAITLIPVFTTL